VILTAVLANWSQTKCCSKTSIERLAAEPWLPESGSLLHVGSQEIRGRVQCELGSRRRQGPGCADPRRCKLTLGMWNITSLVGKEPELVCEGERYQLDKVGLASTHGVGSGTKSYPVPV